MTTLVLSVHSAPAETRSLLAYHYAQAALTLGHSISQVFFYQAGVLHGQRTVADPHGVTQAWQQLATQHGFELVLCATVVEQDYQLSPDALAAHYTLGGLTEFSSAAARADKIMQF
ncbi:DsrE family protein [Pseudidiomarina sediminum]|uniref:DsrE family protein n=1 Tax=Pseudidiomarina sediminum TaxID=431675 RepID=UPI0004184B9F|nr:DsrE family protein [Pseudidiomarina sediminum]